MRNGSSEGPGYSPHGRGSLRCQVAATVSRRNPRRTFAYIGGFPQPTDGPTFTASKTSLARKTGAIHSSGLACTQRILESQRDLSLLREPPASRSSAKAMSRIADSDQHHAGDDG